MDYTTEIILETERKVEMINKGNEEWNKIKEWFSYGNIDKTKGKQWKEMSKLIANNYKPKKKRNN